LIYVPRRWDAAVANTSIFCTTSYDEKLSSPNRPFEKGRAKAEEAMQAGVAAKRNQTEGSEKEVHPSAV
jgi:hypothetical protein